MLGRLKMSIEDFITVYPAFSEKVFKKRNIAFPVKAFKAAAGKSWFDANILEQAIRDLLSDRGMDPEALFTEDPDPACKV